MNTRQAIISVTGGLVTVILIASVVFLIIKLKSDPEKEIPPKILRKVKSELVVYRPQNTSIQSSGRVVSQQAIDIISEVQGKILAGDVPLKKGQEFRENDILVKLYDRDAAYSLQARKSAYLNSIANILPDLKIDYSDDYEAWVEFFEAVEIEKSLPELPKVNSRPIKIFLASRNILSEYYAIKSDEVRLKKYTIYAPYNGAIQNVLLEVGSVANPGSRIAQIIKTSQLEVEIPIEGTSASWLKIGDRAVLSTETNDTVGEAYVKRIASYIDPQTQSINVYLAITKQYEKLFPGEYLKIEFPGMEIDNAMEIPRNAVFNNNLVFTIEEGMLTKKPVNLLKINQNTIFFNGLEEGTEVVTEPLANANEGMQVQSEYTAPPQPDSVSVSAAVN